MLVSSYPPALVVGGAAAEENRDGFSHGAEGQEDGGGERAMRERCGFMRCSSVCLPSRRLVGLLRRPGRVSLFPAGDR